MRSDKSGIWKREMDSASSSRCASSDIYDFIFYIYIYVKRNLSKETFSPFVLYEYSSLIITASNLLLQYLYNSITNSSLLSPNSVQ